jgi:hypothetical protein
MSAELIHALSFLPNDFVHSFSPTTLALFNNLPKKCTQLFTDSFYKKQLMCFGARMTVGDTITITVICHSLGNAKVHAQIIPFSSTFTDVALSVGGLTTFMPLLLQVDMPVAAHDQDPSAFLTILLQFFAELSQSSSDMEERFFAEEGTKCLGHLISRIKPALMRPNALTQLVS